MDAFRQQRRTLLGSLSAAALLPVMPGLAVSATPTTQSNRFVLVILRGALDGLAAVQPYGDPDLASLRQSLVVPEQNLLKLDSFFGLHPALAQLHAMYGQRELEVFHAVATPYRERSHFDGQNVLETGLSTPNLSASGWLNALVPALIANDPSAMAIGGTMPKVLHGQHPVGAWSPDVLPGVSESTLVRLERLYQQDVVLGVKLAQALQTQMLLAESGMSAFSGRSTFATLADAAATFLSQDNGPAVAVMEMGGWDTHANQGGQQGQLAQNLALLDTGLGRLRQGLGGRWSTTQVLVVTEFGRTAAVNGTNGTDHGTGTVAFRLGGMRHGGVVNATWPGLKSGQLYEGRDLDATRDLRTLFEDAAVHLTGKPLALPTA